MILIYPVNDFKKLSQNIFPPKMVNVKFKNIFILILKIDQWLNKLTVFLVAVQFCYFQDIEGADERRLLFIVCVKSQKKYMYVQAQHNKTYLPTWPSSCVVKSEVALVLITHSKYCCNKLHGGRYTAYVLSSAKAATLLIFQFHYKTIAVEYERRLHFSCARRDGTRVLL